jgi:hypothetical protein
MTMGWRAPTGRAATIELRASPRPRSLLRARIAQSRSTPLREPGRRPAQPQRKEFWARWSTRLVVTVCVIAALIGLALITDPGPEAWYTKMGELIEAVISKAHTGPVVGR